MNHSTQANGVGNTLYESMKYNTESKVKLFILYQLPPSPSAGDKGSESKFLDLFPFRLPNKILSKCLRKILGAASVESFNQISVPIIRNEEEGV